jgi:hypothetical protein
MLTEEQKEAIEEFNAQQDAQKKEKENIAYKDDLI